MCVCACVVICFLLLTSFLIAAWNLSNTWVYTVNTFCSEIIQFTIRTILDVLRFQLCVYVCVCVHPEGLWTWCLINWWEEFHQIYKFCACGDKDELIRFWGQKVKGQGHSQTKYGHKHWWLPIEFCLDKWLLWLSACSQWRIRWCKACSISRCLSTLPAGFPSFLLGKLHCSCRVVWTASRVHAQCCNQLNGFVSVSLAPLHFVANNFISSIWALMQTNGWY